METNKNFRLQRQLNAIRFKVNDKFIKCCYLTEEDEAQLATEIATIEEIITIISADKGKITN